MEFVRFPGAANLPEARLKPIGPGVLPFSLLPANGYQQRLRV
jgi:hypothetical protein